MNGHAVWQNTTVSINSNINIASPAAENIKQEQQPKQKFYKRIRSEMQIKIVNTINLK